MTVPIPIERGRTRGQHSRPRPTRWIRRMAGAVGKAIARPVADPLRRLAEIPLTTLGLASCDAAAFVGNLIAGLAVTGLSLILLEYLIADE